MSCGLEHLSNCHGELTMLTMGAGAGMLWLRRSWSHIVMWVKSWSAPKECNHDHEEDTED